MLTKSFVRAQSPFSHRVVFDPGRVGGAPHAPRPISRAPSRNHRGGSDPEDPFVPLPSNNPA
jgi:hypothetical protein